VARVNQVGHRGEAVGDIETRLRSALREAMKARDMVAAFALRSALSAIGNAEAVPADPGGPAEVARGQLSPADIQAIVQAEISERETTAVQYQESGHGDRAERLGREAQILRTVLGA
jgi:uncharacterized protein